VLWSVERGSNQGNWTIVVTHHKEEAHDRTMGIPQVFNGYPSSVQRLSLKRSPMDWTSYLRGRIQDLTWIFTYYLIISLLWSEL